jgi:signal transduction histidine kinase/purine-cytosine permease-like protein
MPVIRVKRNYQAWVANETLEDYSLRYAAKTYRKWPSLLLANTALGGISFLALEAIGGVIMLSYGFANAFPAIVVVSLLIFLTSLPITYYSSRYNIDMDLLTRGAGFGYFGSTITSLIYASFTFIFFALEAAIMAQALELCFGLPIMVGYVLCSLVIIPIAFFGVTLINHLQLWTQPLWIVLLVLPFVFIFQTEPEILSHWADFSGRYADGGEFNVLLFGAATGVLFSLVPQIGEQVDYLRFLPERMENNARAWWFSLLAAGPGWIVIGALKILAGGLLAFLVVSHGGLYSDAIEPIHMYIKAYGFVFDSPLLVLLVATLFVVISQVKINVTNAYAGSLAWSNFFSRVAHYHPGRVVWLIFNVLIALLMMLLGIFETLEAVLSVYGNIAIAWIGAIVADLVVLKPLGVSPPYIEFKRAHLYNINPVGCGAMLIASLISIVAFSGALGPVAEVYSAFLSLGIAFVCAILIGLGTKGKYYIARQDVHYRESATSELVLCSLCDHDYEREDMAHCPFYEGPICSLCCSLDVHCHDACKAPEQPLSATPASGATIFARLTVEPGFNRRIVRFLGLFGFVALVTGAAMLLSYRLLDTSSIGVGNGVDVQAIFIRLYAGALVLIAIGVWWIVLTHESRELSERELLHSLHNLEMTREELVQSEKLASLGGLVAGVAHEINTPVGITVSAASFLADKTKTVRQRVEEGTLQPSNLSAYLADAEESARLLLSNANRAADIIQSFKQVAVDRTSDEQREFNLRASLYEIVQSLQPRLKRTACRVSVDCPANIRVHSYPGPLGQVLSNLIMNSLHHAYGPGESGHIRISAQSESDSVIEIRCADSGAGIAAEHLAKIFEPFFTTKRGKGGSGLGLYVVYNIVTAKLGGSIRVQSTKGEGTIFVLRLPRWLAVRSTETEGLPQQNGGHADA